MYLGVHTPQDVIVSIVIALALIFLLYPLFKKAEDSPKLMYAILSSLTVLTVAYLLFICFFPFPKELFAPDAYGNYLSAKENGFTLAGCMLGLIVVYTADLKWIKFDTRALWWVQIIKIVGGLALVILAKERLRFPLDAILPADTWARMVRYFIMVIIGGALWPMTFKYFSRIKSSKHR